MSMSLKEIFNEHKWLWLAVGVLVFSAGCVTAVWLNQRDADVDVPVMEATITDEASRKISETIVEAQKERDKLPEVVKNAKEQAIQNVGSDGDADIARRWNCLLGRYREHRTPAGGL